MDRYKEKEVWRKGLKQWIAMIGVVKLRRKNNVQDDSNRHTKRDTKQGVYANPGSEENDDS